jgi:hypothetical protein
MAPIPARSGALWIKHGWELYKQQPMQLSALFLANLMLTVLVGSVPFLGLFFYIALIPILTMSLMTACALIERKEPVTSSVFLSVFRSKMLPTLLQLGVVYFLACLLAVLASRWVDDGIFWKIITGELRLDPKSKIQPDFKIGLLSTAAFFLPALFLFWYAAPLILWQKMTLTKALFYSFFAVWRARSAFLLYAFTWLSVCLFLPGFAIILIGTLLGDAKLVQVIILPFMLILNVILYCSFYPSYTQVFDKPDLS